MVLVAISFIYILFTTINFGLLFNALVKTRVTNFAVLSTLGLLAVTILACIWAIFGRINWEFQSLILLLNIGITFKHKNTVVEVYKSLFQKLQLLPGSLKILMVVIAVFIVAQCASIPYVIDNESYYLQTIKWLNEYGLIKGLGNLHPFFAQTSAWHITQSAFNYSFLYRNFNDISGFCLLLGNLFAIVKLNDYLANGNKTYLIIGLLPLANVFLLQFISAPSPDIPIYVFSFFIFFYFMDRYATMNAETFTLISILVIFCLFIKTTAVALLLIPIILLVIHFKRLLPKLVPLTSISVIIAALFCIKNTIVSGYPLFPIVGFNFDLDYSIPKTVAQYYYETTKYYGFFVTPQQYNSMSLPQLFLHWLTMPKLHGLFNKISIILMIVSPVFIYRYLDKKAVWILYIVMCAQMVLLFVSSPQYRFFMNFLLLFSFIIVASVLSTKKQIIPVLYVFTLLTGFVLFIPVNLNNFTKNKFVMTTSTFSFNNLIVPYKNSKLDTPFKTIKTGNLIYNTPTNTDFYWATGDGELPCASERQIVGFKIKYGIVPQMRGKTLREGFYAKTVTK
jgi:hypothetical protein